MNKEKVSEMEEGRITNEELEDWKGRLGVSLRISNIFNTKATEDSIKHFVDGIGDTNSLWLDKEHAEKTQYGTLVAPPSWLYSVFPTWVLQGLPGVHAFHSGNDWTFYKPIAVGTKIKPKCYFTGFDVKKSKFAGRIVREFQKAEFYDGNDELLAETDLWLIRAERGAAQDRGKYSGLDLPHPWSDEELEKIEEQILSEAPRGPETRYWEDVEVGNKVGPLTKGPFGKTDMIAYCVGAAPVEIKAFRAMEEIYDKHPAWGFRDPETSSNEPIYSVHYNELAAKNAGVPIQYDVGVQRQCMLIHLLTDWMGDDGWLKNNYAEYRKFYYYSDVMWLIGEIVDKYTDENDEACVDIETHAINQRGEDIMPGYSTVILPSRERDTWPIKERV